MRILFLIVLPFFTYCSSVRGKTLGCRNVAIYKDVAYGACGKFIVTKDLITQFEERIDGIDGDKIEADDLAISDGYLFTISLNNHLRMYDLAYPRIPRLVDKKLDVPATFYTGIDAKDGFVAISGGLSKSSLIPFSQSGLGLKSSIPTVDKYFGRPDVAIFTSHKEKWIVHSLDVQLTYKWGVEITHFTDGEFAGNKFIPLEAGFSPFELLSYAPGNFPITSVKLGGKLYISHWKTREIISVNLMDSSPEIQSRMKFTFTIGHMTSHGGFIYFISREKKRSVFKFDPLTRKVTTIKVPETEEPMSLAVEDGYIAIADKTKGILISVLD